jgi:hypothetical protein
MTTQEELETKIKTTEFWLNYFCCADFSGKARKHMNRQIGEWNKQLENVNREYKKV